MEKKPLFSILVVANTEAAPLMRTLRSIESQSFQNYECLVIANEEATLATQSQLNEERSLRVHVVNTQATGFYPCANLGITRSNGEKLIFLNPGDVFINTKCLEELAERVGEEEVTYHDVLIETQENLLLRRYPDKIHPTFWLLSDLSHQSVVFSKKFFEDLGPYDQTQEFASYQQHLLRSYFHTKHSWAYGGKCLLLSNSKSTKRSKQRLKDTQEKQENLKLMPTHLRVWFGRRILLGRRLLAKRNKLLDPLFKFFFQWLTFEVPANFLPIDTPLPKALRNLPRMRVLLLNTFESGGGAAMATSRLQSGLQRIGVDAQLLVLHQSMRSHAVHRVKTIRYPRKIFSILKSFYQALVSRRDKNNNQAIGMRSPGLVGWSKLSESVRELNPDIIHLNWLNFGLASIDDIEELFSLGKPVLWTTHDMWAFCGTEHLRRNLVENETTGGSRFSRSIARQKQRVFQENSSQLKLIAPSTWMKEQASRSEVTHSIECNVIHHGVDSKVFSPKAESLSREALGLPPRKKILLFGAVDASSDPNKGALLLREALSYFAETTNPNNHHLAILGHCDPECFNDIPFSHNCFGMIRVPELLALIYSAADIVVLPSRIESFGQMAVEAMACGTPVLCFDTSGFKDTVIHKKTGYRAECFDPEGLSRGISWLLSDQVRLERLGRDARLRVVEHFDLLACARKHSEIYSRLTEGSFPGETINLAAEDPNASELMSKNALEQRPHPQVASFEGSF